MDDLALLENLKRQKLLMLESKVAIKKALPHLYGFPWYTWAKKFFDSRNRKCLITAANQISKSSTQIRKVIHWATAVNLWPELWPDKTPRVFWYMYPSLEVATKEVEGP